MLADLKQAWSRASLSLKWIGGSIAAIVVSAGALFGALNETTEFFDGFSNKMPSTKSDERDPVLDIQDTETIFGLEINYLDNEVGIFRIANKSTGYMNVQNITLYGITNVKGKDGLDYSFPTFQYFFYSASEEKPLAIAPPNSSVPFRTKVGGIDIITVGDLERYVSETPIEASFETPLRRTLSDGDIETLVENSICYAELVGTYDQKLVDMQIDCEKLLVPLSHLSYETMSKS